MKTQQPSSIQVSSSEIVQKRAMSVVEAEANNGASPNIKQQIQKINETSLQPPRRAGAYRSAGVKAQLQSQQQEAGSSRLEQQSKMNLHG